jgi:hypothetical protein
MKALIDAFTNDSKVITIAVLVALDFVLGVSAGLAARTFRFGWLADFLRRDVLGKLIPYFAVWAAVHVGGDLEILGHGAIETTVGLAVVAAIAGSILNSLRDLGLLKGASDVIAGSDDPPPVP